MIALCSDSVAQPAAAGVASLSLLRSTMAGAEMTGSATEQLDVDMDSSLPAPAGQPGPTGSATEQPYSKNDSGLGNCPARPPDAIVLVPHGTLKWEIRVSFNNDMWWAMPHELSDPILQEWQQGAQQVSFIWDWKNARKGSYQPDGAETSINRYIIDFDTMQQRNTDNNRIRKVQVVGVLR